MLKRSGFIIDFEKPATDVFLLVAQSHSPPSCHHDVLLVSCSSGAVMDIIFFIFQGEAQGHISALGPSATLTAFYAHQGIPVKVVLGCQDFLLASL